MYQKHIGKLLFLQSDLLKEYKGLVHGISTRIGGVSSEPFDSLNLSFTTGDNTANTLENRRRICRALDIQINTLSVGEQVHKSNVKVVRHKDKGKGGLSHTNILLSVDAMLTNHRNIALMALSADCPLVICYDPMKKVIGLIHASWRGLAENICLKTIRRMRQEFNCQAENIHTFLSPSIGTCCYEVKQDFINKTSTKIPYVCRYFKIINNKIFFNLWSFTRAQLRHAGLVSKHIESSDICTKCHPEWFYSFRRDGAKTGRFGAIASFK